MEQLNMIDKVRQLAQADERISAVLMYGSFTQGAGDRYSDIEFYIFVREGEDVDKREWVSEIRPVAMFFTNEMGTDVAVFDNLIRGEFHFHPASETGIVSTWEGALDFSLRGEMVITDKDGLLAEALDGIGQVIPEWNTPENIAWVADSMINNLIFMGNVIRRGEHARAAHLFFFLEKYLAQLIRLYCGVTEHWLDPMKGLENEIPAVWLEQYEKCVPGLGGGTLQDCFANTISLTGELFSLLDVPEHDISLWEKIAKHYGI